MPRKKAAKFKCAKCGKEFGMAMHLGRHMTTIHGRTPKTAKRRKARKAAKAGARKGKRIGRPPGVVGRLGLRNMSVDQLMGLITAAKAEVGHRIAEIQDAIR